MPLEMGTRMEGGIMSASLLKLSGQRSLYVNCEVTQRGLPVRKFGKEGERRGGGVQGAANSWPGTGKVITLLSSLWHAHFLLQKEPNLI